jgi:hypothetical protein
VLSRNIADINEALLTTVCQEHWPETQTLEFKRQLPATDEKGRHEFLKDVCAFANAAGGDIVYGVQEDASGHAGQVLPIATATFPVDATRRRLAQIVEGGIEPRVSGVVFHPVTLASGDYVMVVRVPSSFRRPHRYRLGDHTRWVVRADTHTADLTYAQIKDAFDTGASLGEKARQFRDDRLSRVLSGTNARPLKPGPRCVVHLIPLAAFAGPSVVDVVTLHDNRYTDFMFHDWGGASRTFNLDGLLVHPGSPKDVAYTQVFRSGALEAARWVGRHWIQSERDRTSIPSADVTAFIRDALFMFVQATKKWGIAGPAIAAAALLDVGEHRFAYMSQGGWLSEVQTDRPNFVIPEVWVDQLAAVDDADTLARPLLDTLWQAFDHARCAYYNAQGAWILR